MKRNILKIMTLCTVAVLALASCKKDNQTQGNVPEKGFLATVEANQGNGGRTHLVGTEVQWNAGDQIVVRNGNGTSATFSLSAGENTMNGTFLSSQSGDEFFQPTYTAVYPATGNSITGEGAATFTLPATQAYVANSFANGAMPMMAVSGEQTLEFKNALGGICFPMTGSQTVTRLVLTSNSADDNLSGVFAADYNNGEPTLTYTSGGANSITLDCGAGVTLDATTATDFIIMVPAGSLANGFKLEAYNGEEKIFEKTNDANLGESFIPRSVIRKVNNPLEVVEATTGLTFEAKAAGSTVKFNTFSSTITLTPSLEYSTDGGTTWNAYTNGTTLTMANVGDKVMFRGDNTAFSTGNNRYYRFQNTGECYVYGNIMSILDKENYATATMTNPYTFNQLFEGNTSIYSHPDHSLELPATTLTKGCYRKMFYGCTNWTMAPELPATTLDESCYTLMFSGCTSLTTAPELPATTLSRFCYHSMFEDCTSLTTAPELPATTIDNACYYWMFRGCTSLTTAPELPATTILFQGYYGMFHGCTSLTTAPELPATTLDYGCYQTMFSGCTSLTTAPEILPAMTLAEYCYANMFTNCTSLTTAPELPATTLEGGCYDHMFYGCTSLTTAPELPATETTGTCYGYMFTNCTSLNYVKCLAEHLGGPATQEWLLNVAATGTFVKNPSLTGWSSSGSGIPTGWTVVDAEL